MKVGTTMRWVVAAVLWTGVAAAQDVKPTVAPAPLELRRKPEAISKKDAEGLSIEFDRLVRAAGARIPTPSEMTAALTALKRQDFASSDEALAQLAQKAQTLYAIHVQLDYPVTGTVVGVGKVVRADGKRMGEEVRRLGPAGGVGRVVDLGAVGARQPPAGQLQPQAQVHVLAVHVKAFVEAVDAGVGGPAQQQEGGVDPVGPLTFANLGRPAQHVARQQPGGSGQQALVVLPAARGVELNGVHGAGPGIGFEHGRHGAPGLGAPPQIGVEHGEERAGAVPAVPFEGAVVVGAEAGGRGVLGHVQIEWPIPRAQPDGQARFGQVQRDDDAPRAVPAGLRQLGQQPLDLRPVPMADDGCRDVHAWRPRVSPGSRHAPAARRRGPWRTAAAR